MARPKVLDTQLIDRMAMFAAMGAPPTVAGVSERSLRRWIAVGRAELADLSPEARLVLALDRADEAAKATSWQSALRHLEEASRPLDEVLDASM